MPIHGNTVPVNLDENEPQGNAIRVRQLDDYIRETRSALIEYLERSHVPFGDPKAGEPLEGSAVAYVAQAAGGAFPPAVDSENRLRYQYGNRTLAIVVDRGAGVVVDNVLGPATNSVVSFSVLQDALGTSFADIEVAFGTPMQVDYTIQSTNNSPRMCLRVEASISIENQAGADRAASFRLMEAQDAGAFGSITSLYTTPQVLLKAGQAMVVHLFVDLDRNPAALASTWRYRVQGRASAGGSIFVNGSVGLDTASSTLLLTPRRANSDVV